MEGEAQKKAIAALKHQSAPVFNDAVKYEPWKDIECMYLFCDEDKALPLQVQEGMAALLGPNAASFHVKASHSPFLSRPQEVADGLEYAAKIGTERI